MSAPHHTQTPSRARDALSGATSLAAEQCKRLYQNTLLGVLISLIFSVILSLSHWQNVGTAEIITWNLILYFALSVRFILWTSWKLAAPVLPSKWWLNFARMGVWLTGLSWGLSTYYFFSQAQSTQQILFAFALAGVVGCSLPLLSTDKHAAVGYILFAVMPLTILLLLQDNHASLYMTLMTLTFIVFTIRKSAIDERHLREHFFLKRKLEKTTHALDHDISVHSVIHESFIPFFTDHDAPALIRRLLDGYCVLNEFQFAVLLPFNQPERAITANNHASELVLSMIEKGSVPLNIEGDARFSIHNRQVNFGLDHHVKAISNYALVRICVEKPTTADTTAIMHCNGGYHLLIVGNRSGDIHRKDVAADTHIFSPLRSILYDSRNSALTAKI